MIHKVRKVHNLDLELATGQKGKMENENSIYPSIILDWHKFLIDCLVSSLIVFD